MSEREGLPGLFMLHRERPGLLLRELAWRWSCGGLLLLIAAYQGWRIWSASQPALAATGILRYRDASSLSDALTDPLQLLTACNAAVRILEPQVVRATLGLLPLFLFVWALAFGLGRTHVLRRWDATLPSRPMLLAQAEALRLGVAMALGGLWVACIWLGAQLPDAGGGTAMLALLLFALAVSGTFVVMRLRPALIVATALALTDGGSWREHLKHAQGRLRDPALLPLRTAVRRSRMTMAVLALILLFVPAPFGLGWPLLAWWAAWSLPPLAAADAWRLGAFFTLLRTLRGTVV